MLLVILGVLLVYACLVSQPPLVLPTPPMYTYVYHYPRVMYIISNSGVWDAILDILFGVLLWTMEYPCLRVACLCVVCQPCVLLCTTSTPLSQVYVHHIPCAMLVVQASCDAMRTIRICGTVRGEWITAPVILCQESLNHLRSLRSSYYIILLLSLLLGVLVIP